MKKIKLNDLAKLTGYSTSTISRSLNGNEKIPLETREKIKKMAKEMGYIPNLSARNLSKKSSKNIGVFMQSDSFVPPNDTFTNIFWSPLNKIIQEKGYEPSLYLFSNLENLKDKISQMIESSLIDGAIIFSKVLSNDKESSNKIIDFFEEKKYPYVLLYYAPDRYSHKVFTADNYQSAKIITELFIEKGLKKIATVTSNITDSFRLRREGYSDTLKENGIEVNPNIIFTVEPSVENGEKIAEEIYKNRDKIEAVFVQHDILAFGVLKGLIGLGVKIPEEISIIGHDNLSYKTWFSPLLTTFSLEIDRMCESSVEYLIEEKILKKTEIPFKKFLGKIIEGETLKK